MVSEEDAKHMEEKEIETSEGLLRAYYREPTGTNALVVFVPGTGSGRDSRRNRAVAEELWQGGMGTVLMDLLTPEEGEEPPDGHLDLDSHTRRVLDVVERLREEATGWLRVGLFGPGTGAAVALNAAIRKPEDIRAVVSRGGRPDLVQDELDGVEVPSLFLVAEEDEEALRVSREAVKTIRKEGVAKLEVVAEADHLFEEPGALQMVAQRSLSWFEEHLVKGQPYSPPEPPGDRATEPEQ